MSQAGTFGSGGVFPPGTVVQTITGNSGGAVGPDGSNNINIVGSGDITVTGNPGTNTLDISLTGGIATEYITDTGTAEPVGGILNINGFHGITTFGSTNIVLVALNNFITLGDLSVITPGSDALTVNTGNITIDAGNLNLPATSNANTGVIDVNSISFIHSFGTNNTFVGSGAGNFTLTTASAQSNTALGYETLTDLTTGHANTAVGLESLSTLTTGTNNVCCGDSTLSLLVSGSNNIAIGHLTGSNLTSSESSNILIGSDVGVIADSNTTRIGNSGSGAGQQNKCFVAGINGINVGSTAQVVTMGSSATVDQLGTAVITGGTGITITPSANVITISSTGTTTLAYTNVNTSPYVVLSTDDYLSVDCSAGAITIELPNAATLGRTFIIKDRTGSAATHNITVTTVGGVVDIDTATTFVMNTAFESIDVIGSGNAYEIY
jgi:hypothetical protein